MRKRLENWHWVFFAMMWALSGWILLQTSLYGVLPRRHGGGSFTFAENPVAFVILATVLAVFFFGMPPLGVLVWKGERKTAEYLRRWGPPLDNSVRRPEEER